MALVGSGQITSLSHEAIKKQTATSTKCLLRNPCNYWKEKLRFFIQNGAERWGEDKVPRPDQSRQKRPPWDSSACWWTWTQTTQVLQWFFSVGDFTTSAFSSFNNFISSFSQFSAQFHQENPQSRDDQQTCLLGSLPQQVKDNLPTNVLNLMLIQKHLMW